MRFTRPSIAALTLPPGKAYALHFDEALPGFGIRLNQSGRHSWIVQFRRHGKSVRETIGRADAVPLEDARRAAKAVLSRVALGADPQAEKAAAKAARAVTFGTQASVFLTRQDARRRPRYMEDVRRHLDGHCASLAARPLSGIRRADLAALLNEIAAERGPIAANRTRASLSSFFGWCVGEGLIEANPIIGTNKPAEEVSRDRVLTDEELIHIWRACRDDAYGYIVRLLLLTGQRRDEVASLSWEEIDLKKALWTLPAGRTKNARPHEVPLAQAALAILKNVPRAKDRELVFGRGEGGFAAWSQSRKRLDKRLVDDEAEMKPWRLHDLRRTMATRLGDLGTAPHVVEALLNHVSGSKAGVAGTYNRALYSPEKRAALDLWGAHVMALVTPR